MAQIKIYAGRGCCGPENTAAAFKAAFDAGADAAVCDIRRTADGQFVAFRDAGTGRLCGRDWEIAATEWGHLKTLRVAGREQIAHLDDLLNLLILNPSVEFFFRPHGGVEAEAVALALQIAKAGVQDRVFLTTGPCRKHLLAAARNAVPGLGAAVAPKCNYGLLDKAWKAGASRVVTGWKGGCLSREAFYLGASLFDLKTQADEAEAAGIEISAGPAAHPRDVRRLKEIGARAVWTTDVEMAAKYV